MHAHRFDTADHEIAAFDRREALRDRQAASRRLRGDVRGEMAGAPDVDAAPVGRTASLTGIWRVFGRAWLDCGAALN